MDRPNSASRQYILFVFMLLGTFGYLNSQTASMLTQTFGFYVPSLELPAGPWVNYLRIICLSGVAGCIYLAIRARSYWAICTPLAFYLWVDYPLTNFALLPILPALHAIQYLPLAFERGVKGRGAFWFAVSTSVAAALLFGVLRTAPRHLLSIGVVVAMAELTLNLHHYFLDAHIWRARVGKYRRAMGYEET
ncbi:MAG: hypothetical protein EOP11_03825 [Proteobacteria bacterium]|nr:MAG: hypothetical protein EOP11_03825 [Pseudomonadota bacterium]